MQGVGVAHPSLVCWRNIDVRFEAPCCFVGAQLEGIVLVTACVLGFDSGADCRVGWRAGCATTVGLWVQLPHRLHTYQLRSQNS